MFRYYNANPRQRRVNDCTVRAISKATGHSWDEAYDDLSNFAQVQCIMPDEVEYIDEFLERNFKRIYSSRKERITVNEFLEKNPKGTFLITMAGHITCAIDGCIYDTFDPGERYVWQVFEVKREDTY